MAERLNDELPEELARALAAADQRAAASAQRVDPAAVAAAVSAALRRPAVTARPASEVGWWLRVAAAAALVVAGSIAVRAALQSGAPVEAAAQPSALPLHSAAVLDSVADSAGAWVMASLEAVPVSVVDSAVSGSALLLEDLSEVELRALLQAMESTEESQ